jgi:hypothetical protein
LGGVIKAIGTQCAEDSKEICTIESPPNHESLNFDRKPGTIVQTPPRRMKYHILLI